MPDKNIVKKYPTFDRFINGIADYEKEGTEDTVLFSRNIDLRSDPRSFQLNPRTVKESGTTIEDFLKWPERVRDDIYWYGDTGKIYKRANPVAYSKVHTVQNSHGNGLSYYGEDNFLYYTSDKLIGRYGPLDSDLQSATFVDDFLGAEGGVPTNTHSIDLEASSSMYLTRADNTDLSITGSLTMEIYPKFESLPTSPNWMTLMSKWNESGNQRAYMFGVLAASGYFGDGSDGALTISANTTDAPIDSACTGTVGATALSATNASFVAGQEVLIIQMRGATAGTWQRNKIQSYTAGTITLENNLNATYSSGAQVLVLKQYTDVTIDAGFTWTAKAWDGTVGGILAFLHSGTLTVNGTISAVGKGFRGGSRPSVGSGNGGKQGESYLGTWDTVSTAASYGAGGGGPGSGSSSGGPGAGGSHLQAGTVGQGQSPGIGYGFAGSAYGSQDLIAGMWLGSGGGSGGNSYNSSVDSGRGGQGGHGGGIIFTLGDTVIIGSNGLITVNGGDGQIGDLKHASGGGGAGAGGSLLIYCENGTFGTNKLDASAGAFGYNTNGYGIQGGNAGYGQIHVNYLTAYTGDAFELFYSGNPNTSPQTSARTTRSLVYATQDSTLSSTAGYYLFLKISSNGTNSETLKKPLTIDSSMWKHLAVKWVASTKTATFYANGQSIGSVVGTLGSIADTTALFAIGAYFNSGGTATGFFDGKLDEGRLWEYAREDEDISRNVNRQLAGTEPGLIVNYRFNNNATDSTANAYDLTAVNSPTYTTDVPFSGVTSRLDLDQSLDTSGDTYALETSIDDSSSAKKQEFVPDKDPQKSVEVNIAAVGSGDWTLTVHDSLNRVVASKTILNSLLHTGDYEFIFDDVWRPVRGATYHFHITSTVADGTVVSTSNNNLNTADFHTYYQFLVEDVDFHPIMQFLNFEAIGNERYLATWDAAEYIPHRLVFPAGYRVRALGTWNEYLAIGCWKGSTVKSHEQGMIFFWNGYSDTYDHFIEVPEGAINAVFGSRGKLHIWAGYKGHHLEYSAGRSAEKVKQAPKIQPGETIEILPGAVTMFDTMIRYGLGGGGDSENVQRGVYTWGSSNRVYNDALTFDHTISTGNYMSTVKVGALIAIDGKLLVAWQDGISYGVDVLDPTAAPYPSGTVEFLVQDDGAVWDERIMHTVRGDFIALNTGESVAVKYKIDREGTWQEMESPQNTADETTARLPIVGGRNKEYQIAADLQTTTTTSPKMLSVAVEESPVTEEKVF